MRIRIQDSNKFIDVDVAHPYLLGDVNLYERELKPKIKEYIDKSGYNKLTAAVRLGVSNTYIHTMIVQLANLNKEDIITDLVLFLLLSEFAVSCAHNKFS